MFNYSIFFNKTIKKFLDRKCSNFYMFLKSINNKFINNTLDLGTKLETFNNYKIFFYKVNKKLHLKKIRLDNNGIIIYKEKFTNLWFLRSNENIIFYIKKKDLENFLKRIYDTSYTFLIYETSFHCICFCTSHYTYQMDDILKNIFLDYCDKRIWVVSIDFYSNFIILNDGVFIDKEVQVKKERDKMFTWKRNENDENKDIKLKVDIILKYLIHSKHLPNHYFPINT